MQAAWYKTPPTSHHTTDLPPSAGAQKALSHRHQSRMHRTSRSDGPWSQPIDWWTCYKQRALWMPSGGESTEVKGGNARSYPYFYPWKYFWVPGIPSKISIFSLKIIRGQLQFWSTFDKEVRFLKHLLETSYN